MIAHIVTYVMHVSRIQKQFNFDDAGIIAMDETSVWNDMVSNTTVEKTGSNDVPWNWLGMIRSVFLFVWLGKWMEPD